nr:hypothetical protein CFP56_29635 [Quercus suber]
MNVVVHNSLNLCPMKSILYISSTAATISIVLPHENVDGSPVPVLFKDRPPDYHMFLMFILFAFLGAFSALMLQHKPRVGKIFKISAIASMLSALAIVLNAAALCHHRALSEKEMKSVSPEKSLQKRLLQFLSSVLIPNLIATLCSMKSMVYISSTTATISMLIPQDIVDGRPVLVFFRGRPTIYHIFLSCTLFAFLGSFSSLMVQHKPRVERVYCHHARASLHRLLFVTLSLPSFASCSFSQQVYGIYAAASMISALVTFLYATGLRMKLFVEKAAKGLAKKKTHEGAIGGKGRERSISGGRDGKAIRDINKDPNPTPHIQKTGRPQVGFPFSQANGGVEGQDESWDGLEREKGSGGRDGGSMEGGQEEEAVPNIKRETLHIERNGRFEVGFGVSQANGSVERRGGSLDECRDVKGEGSRSGANQARDGEGEGS